MQKEEIKCISITKQNEKWLTIMMLQKKNMKDHNPSWQQCPDHSYRILIIGGRWSAKANALLNLIKEQDDDDYCVIDEIYLCAKD